MGSGLLLLQHYRIQLSQTLLHATGIVVGEPACPSLSPNWPHLKIEYQRVEPPPSWPAFAVLQSNPLLDARVLVWDVAVVIEVVAFVNGESHSLVRDPEARPLRTHTLQGLPPLAQRQFLKSVASLSQTGRPWPTCYKACISWSPTPRPATNRDALSSSSCQ